MTNRRNKNKKINQMNIDEVRQLMLVMQQGGHSQSKRYQHLQARLQTLKIAEVQKEIEQS